MPSLFPHVFYFSVLGSRLSVTKESSAVASGLCVLGSDLG